MDLTVLSLRITFSSSISSPLPPPPSAPSSRPLSLSLLLCSVSLCALCGNLPPSHPLAPPPPPPNTVSLIRDGTKGVKIQKLTARHPLTHKCASPYAPELKKDALNVRPAGPTGRTKKFQVRLLLLSSPDLLFPTDRNGSRELSLPHPSQNQQLPYSVLVPKLHEVLVLRITQVISTSELRH